MRACNAEYVVVVVSDSRENSRGHSEVSVRAVDDELRYPTNLTVPVGPSAYESVSDGNPIDRRTDITTRYFLSKKVGE